MFPHSTTMRLYKIFDEASISELSRSSPDLANLHSIGKSNLILSHIVCKAYCVMCSPNVLK